METEESDEMVYDKCTLDETEKPITNSPSFKEMKFQPREKDETGNEMIRSHGNDNSEIEKVAEQVEGDTISENQINNNSKEDESDENYSSPESLVREWESDHKQTLTPPARELALLAASLHLCEGRRILVSDLTKLGIEKDNVNVFFLKGTEQTVEFVADKPGNFTFRCTSFCSAPAAAIENHFNMVGKLIIHE
jgi:hypothetical protein